MRVALYARYSSDQQREASIADQLRDCRAYAERQLWEVAGDYSDAAVSGATLHRPGIQRLIRDAAAGRFDAILAESLDRFSRDQEGIARLFKGFNFGDVRMVTIADGEITELHVGLKGTMNALFLKDLKDKTRRGLKGRAEAGKSAGGLCFGYRVVKAIEGNAIITGERAINADEAVVVNRIFAEFTSGISPQNIAKRLNAENISGPRGGSWGPSTIHGNAKRGTGILNNELYVGRLVWDRQRYVKDPATGKRVSRPNPRAALVVKEVPELRIVPDELWNAAKRRQDLTRQVIAATGNIGRVARPLHLFSGLIKCESCGSSYVVASAHRLACSGRRERGICTNDLTIRRDELEGRVLTALQLRFFESERFQIFCEEFAAAVNEIRRALGAGAATAARERAKIDLQVKRLTQAILDGVPAAAVKDQLIALESRRDALYADSGVLQSSPPVFHSDMAARYREEVAELRQALEDADCNADARQAVRSMVEEIRLTPRNGELRIDVKGNLAAMLAAASQTVDWQPQIALVAGARNHQYPKLWRLIA